MVTWSQVEIDVDGHTATVNDLAKLVDNNSVITFKVSAEITQQDLKNVGGGEAELYFSVTCSETVFKEAVSTKFVNKPPGLSAESSLKVNGNVVASEIVVSAQITSPLFEDTHSEMSWLKRRIIAEHELIKIPLSTDIVGFPTSAFSFQESIKLNSPWEIVVLATDLSDTFSHSVNLNLNSDNKFVSDLIKGNAKHEVQAELVASITRTILHSVRNLSDHQAFNNTIDIDQIAFENPNSIAAAAQRISKEYFNKSLSSVVGLIKKDPGRFEFELLSQVELFGT